MFLRLPSETRGEQEYLKALNDSAYRTDLVAALDKLDNMKLSRAALRWIKMSKEAVKKWEVRGWQQDLLPFFVGAVVASVAWILVVLL